MMYFGIAYVLWDGCMLEGDDLFLDKVFLVVLLLGSNDFMVMMWCIYTQICSGTRGETWSKMMPYN